METERMVTIILFVAVVLFVVYSQYSINKKTEKVNKKVQSVLKLYENTKKENEERIGKLVREYEIVVEERDNLRKELAYTAQVEEENKQLVEEIGMLEQIVNERG